MLPTNAYSQISYENQIIFVQTVKAWAGNIYKAKTRSKPKKIVVVSTESDQPVTESELGPEPDLQSDHSIEIQSDHPVTESELGSEPDSQSIHSIETVIIKNLNYPVINLSQEYFIMKPVK